MFTHSTCPRAAAEAEFPSPGVDTEVTSLRGRALWGCDSLGERGWHRAWGFRAVSCLGRAGFVFIQLLWRQALRASLLAMKIQVGALCPAAPPAPRNPVEWGILPASARCSLSGTSLQAPGLSCHGASGGGDQDGGVQCKPERFQRGQRCVEVTVTA